MDYIYDHDGIRVGKTINGTDIITYVVDKNRPYAQVLEEQWSNGTLSATTGYVYGDALISRTTNGTPHFYHGACPERRRRDGMGSTRTLTDTTGAVTDTYSYGAYGILLDKTGSTINPYLYRGEQFDADLSSYYLRARYYQPGIGRFLTTDPVEGFPNNPITLHRYVYGNAEPVNHFDPLGKSALIDQLISVGIIAIASGAYAGMSALGFFDSWYEKYGDVLPDAFVFGVSGSTDFMNFIIAGAKWIKDPKWTHYDKMNLGATLGFEILFSVSSAQIGGFWYGGATWMKGETKILPSSIYKGWVWNLWNAKNYRGPFISVNIGPAMLFCNGWPWFFSDGPYGAGYSISPGEKFKRFVGGTSTFSISYTGYKGLLPGMLKNYDDEGEIVSKIIGAQIVFAAIHTVLSFEEGGWFVPAVVFPMEASLAIMTGRAKRIWNRAHNIKLKPEEADPAGTLYRQRDPRPPDWRSGPINYVVNWALQYM